MFNLIEKEKTLCLFEVISSKHSVPAKNNFKSWFLTEDFSTQKAKYTAQGISPAIVDKYLADFRTIKDKKYKQINDPIHGLENITNRIEIDAYSDFHQLETLVDYVKGQTDVVGKLNYKNLNFSGTPIYEDQNIQIFYADSPQACIEYKGNAPYSWCIARTDSSNLFNSYRYHPEKQPAFYFVKNKEKTNIEFGKEIKKYQNGKFQDKYHFFVIQVIRYADPKDHSEKQYIVTSAENDGDKEMSWDEIIRIEPRLQGKEETFQPKPLTQEESKFYKKYRYGTSNKKFIKLSYDQKDMYMNVYVRGDKGLTDKQYESLPEELKNKYIGLQVGLTDEQYNNNTSEKLKKRYVDVTIAKIKNSIVTPELDKVVNFKNSEMEIFNKHIDKFDLNELSDYHVYDLINYATDKQEMAKLLGQENINKLSRSHVYHLINNATDKQEMFELLGQDNINELSNYQFYWLINYATDKQEMAKLLGQENINKLSEDQVYWLIKDATDKKEMAKLLINKLSDENVYDLINYATDKKEMAKLLGQDNINKLSDQNVRGLINYATDKQEMAKLLSKKT